MKKLLILLTTVLIFSQSYAEVEVPGFAFTGKEIAEFSIRPSFQNISVSFNVRSNFDTYLKQESFRLDAGETKNYNSEDPGGVYSGGFGTSVSAVFVGDIAYRNRVVKAYLDKRYLDVIESFEKYYEKKIKGTDFDEEARLVYSFALMETGAISKSLDILKFIAVNGKQFGPVATDRVAEYMLNIKSYEQLDIFLSGLKKQTPYSLYGWLYSLLTLHRYDRLVEAFEANKAIVAGDGRFYDFYISARYSQGGFTDVTANESRSTENTLGLVADSYLVKAEKKQADALTARMTDSPMKTILMAKSAVLTGDLDTAGRLLGNMRTDEDRLNLFYFYVGKTFPDLSPEFLEKFTFESRINADYQKFYTGVYYLAKGDSRQAVRYLDAVIFNSALTDLAYYYRGLAYSQLDRKRAERYFLKYIETSEDDEKITVSRYMLAQMAYIGGSLDDALMLISTCDTFYCSLLKAKIYLAKNDMEMAWVNAEGLNNDDAALVRATVLYHKKQYADALSEINNIEHKDRDADFLTMLSRLKLGRIYEAETVYRRYSSDREFTDAYLEHMLLSGQYQEVLKLTEDKKAQFSLIRAKSLFSLGRLADAASLFGRIINGGGHSFDAWNGLLSSYIAMGDNAKFAEAARSMTDAKADFDKKDFLIYQTAVQALDIKDTKLATVLLNHFFDTFLTSAYKNDAYLLRGKLFRDTGRIQQCLNDAEIMLAEGRSDDALFLKGECLQSTKPKEALKIFEDMTENSGRFRDLGYSKLIELYTEPKDILRAVNYFKKKDTERYYSGLDTYLSKLSAKGLSENRALLDEMIADRNPNGLAAAYYYIGVINYNEENYENAAVMLMKSHYLFPASDYSAKSLMMTIEAYKKLGKSTDVLERKLKAMKS